MNLLAAAILASLAVTGCTSNLYESAGALQVARSVELDGPFEVAWSPDGRSIAVALSHTGFAVMDAQSGARIAALRDPEFSWRPNGSDHTLEFAPDGKHVIVPSTLHMADPPNTARPAFGIWNLVTGTVERTIARASTLRTFRVSNEAERLAALYYGEIDIYDTSTWALVRGWTVPESTFAIALEPSGRWIAASEWLATRDGTGGARLTVYEVATGRPVATIPSVSPNIPTYLTFLGGSGRIAATANEIFRLVDGTGVRIWDTGTGQQIRTFDPQLDYPEALTASLDGNVLVFVGITDRVLRPGGHPALHAWDTRTGAEIGALTGAGAYFEDAAPPDGRRLAVIMGSQRDPTHLLVVDIGPKQ